MRPTGHIRERSPGSWELRYSFGRDPATGKRRIGTTTIRGTRREAEKELRRLLRTLDLNEHVEPGRMTVREWLTDWLDAIRQEVSPKTHERYEEIVLISWPLNWEHSRSRSSRPLISPPPTHDGRPRGGGMASPAVYHRKLVAISTAF